MCARAHVFKLCACAFDADKNGFTSHGGAVVRTRPRVGGRAGCTSSGSCTTHTMTQCPQKDKACDVSYNARRARAWAAAQVARAATAARHTPTVGGVELQALTGTAFSCVLNRETSCLMWF